MDTLKDGVYNYKLKLKLQLQNYNVQVYNIFKRANMTLYRIYIYQHLKL